MNYDRLIGITNRVAVYATLALFYWVFIFLIITVFDLKVFREHMTETFYLSLLGIFAVLGGAIVLNVMSNLSKISDVLSLRHVETIEVKKRTKAMIIAIILSLPVICGLLFAGNSFSAEKKKHMLISSAESLIAENQGQLAVLADYCFSKEYVTRAENTLNVKKKIDKFFPEVMIIMPDVIDGWRRFLGDSRETINSHIEKATMNCTFQLR